MNQSEIYSDRLQMVIRQSSVDAHSINSFEEYSDSLRESQVSLYDDHDIDEFADLTETEETDEHTLVEISHKRSLLDLSFSEELTFSSALDQTSELLEKVEYKDYTSDLIENVSGSEKFINSFSKVSSSSKIKQDMPLELFSAPKSLQSYLTQKESSSNEHQETFAEELKSSKKESSEVLSNSIALQDLVSDMATKVLPLGELPSSPKLSSNLLQRKSSNILSRFDVAEKESETLSVTERSFLSKESTKLASSVLGGGPSKSSLLPPLNSGEK